MKGKNIKLVISYNGNRFYGWQRQKGQNSVQETIEKTLQKITGEDIKITGCGRTDSKVHAISYVANFKTETSLTTEQIKKALNSNLPTDIHIKSVEIVNPAFHSRYSAKRKTYRYLIVYGERSPFLQGFACYIKEKLNVEAMKKAASHFTGTHNFSAFQASGSKIKDTKRTVYKITIRKEKLTLNPEIKVISIEITADGFLYKMARNIVGTLIYAGLRKLSIKEIPQLIASGDRKKVPPTALPEGLYLKEVIY